MKRRNNKRMRIITLIIVIILVIMMVIPLALEMVRADDGTEKETASASPKNIVSGQAAVCADNIYIDSMPVGGMTRSEIYGAIEERVARLCEDTILLYSGDQIVRVTAGDLGISCTNMDIADLAMLVDRRGNILRKYRADRYISENGAVIFDMEIAANPQKVRELLKDKKNLLEREPVPVSMSLNEDGSLTAIQKVDGFKIDAEESADKICEYIASEWHGGQGGVSMVTEEVKAEGNTADLSEIKDEIGSATTEFDSDNEGRIANIRLAASRVSGTVVYPGEEFDFHAIVGDTTEENGFELAGSYENGSVVDTYGGGICQASTTLYNAVLRAELEVTERSPHSMTVNYVKPSLDAAIAEDVKNLKFKNNTETPIFIYGETNTGSVTFRIFGKETRDPARSIEFESRIVKETEYTTKFRYDGDHSYGSIHSSGGRMGIRAEAWKIIYLNDEKQREERINSSSYDMIPLTYYIGTKGATDAQMSRIKRAMRTGSIAEVRNAVG